MVFGKIPMNLIYVCLAISQCFDEVLDSGVFGGSCC